VMKGLKSLPLNGTKKHVGSNMIQFNIAIGYNNFSEHEKWHVSENMPCTN
jgi:hypothetical protein